MPRIRALCLSAVLTAGCVLTLSSAADAQERPYTEGSVWDVTLVRTTPGQYEAYLADLARVWRSFNDEAVKRGHVVSYRILSSPRATPDDWDLLLLVEYPNMATFDDASEKFDPIAESILGDLQTQGEATVQRAQLRDILGSKLARELTFN